MSEGTPGAKAGKADAAETRAAREAEVLAPDVPIVLSDGRTVEVRELRYGQVVRMGATIRPIARAIAAIIVDRGLQGGELIQFVTDRMREIPEDHPGEFLEIMAASTGLAEREIRELSAEDGELLEAAVMRVNTELFVSRVGRYVRLGTADPGDAPPPARSSPSSSGTDTTPDV